MPARLPALLAAMAFAANAALPAGSLKWSYESVAPIYYSAPAIGADGTVYFGNGMPIPSVAGTRGVFALRADGSLKWRYVTDQNMFTPALGKDGTVFVQDSRSSLYAFDSGGNLKWTYPLNTTSSVGQASPAIAADGTLYIGADVLHAVNPDGTLKWKSFLTCGGSWLCATSYVRSSPAIAPDGTIYVGATGNYVNPDGGFTSGGGLLAAVNPDGSSKWNYILEGSNAIFSSPAIGPDGAVYVGAETVSTGMVFALNPDGTLRWKYASGKPIRSSPALGADGTVYVGTKAGATGNGEVLALRPDGTLRWSFLADQVHPSPEDIYSSPAVGADGTVYVGAETGSLYALTPGGALSWKYATPDVPGFGNSINWTSPAIGRDGTIYIGNNNGTLFAVNSGSLGLAATMSPKFRSDNRNSGRAVAPGSLLTPDAFAFIDQPNVLPGREITSNAVAITGINALVPVSVSNGTYSIDCSGAFTALAGSIGDGQTVCVRHTSSQAPGGVVDTVLDVGGVSDTFTSTTATAFNSPRLANISTRGRVETGNDVMIGGFVIGGASPKKVLITARGPSLTAFGVTGAMANPTLQLFSGQTVIATNDGWGTNANAAEIAATGIAPTNAQEAALLMTLDPGAYTAIVSGVGNTMGVGIVEVFEMDSPGIPLINISTRGQVQTGDNVMIGGFIIQGDSPKTVLVTARGPSLAPFGIANPLANPSLQLFSGQTMIASNDDWQSNANAAAIQATGVAPTNALESAILVTLNPGAYTAIVTGVGGGTGVGIVEVFAQ